MSKQDVALVRRYADYVASHSPSEDPFLRSLRRDAVARGLPEISITWQQAKLLQIVLTIAGAREVVEVGTLAGYSAIAMARALAIGGRVRTIEVSAERAALARRWVEMSDVAGSVEVIHGDAREVLRTMASDSVDATFLDADKENQAQYFKEAGRIVRSCGAIIIDNVFAFGRLFSEDDCDPEVLAVRDFNEAVRRERWVEAVIVPLGDGLWVGRKR